MMIHLVCPQEMRPSDEDVARIQSTLVKHEFIASEEDIRWAYDRWIQDDCARDPWLVSRDDKKHDATAAQQIMNYLVPEAEKQPIPDAKPYKFHPKDLPLAQDPDNSYLTFSSRPGHANQDFERKVENLVNREVAKALAGTKQCEQFIDKIHGLRSHGSTVTPQWHRRVVAELAREATLRYYPEEESNLPPTIRQAKTQQEMIDRICRYFGVEPEPRP